MAQYTTGTVSVTNGSNIVTGTDTTWVTDGITTAYSFIISVAAGGDGVLYDIASVDSETQITLTTNYGGTSISDASYGVQRDFTTPDNIPEISNGDVGTAGVFTRAMRTIQTLITSASSALTTHIADTTTHGTIGDIVGTSDTQELSNKTITAAANTLDATVEDIAGLTPTDGNFIVGDGANFVTESGATALTSIGGQPVDATLTSISSLGTAANKYMYTTGIDTWAEGDITSFGRSILDDADEAAFKATVNLEIGTDVQAYDAALTAYAGTLTAANKIPYATALDTAGELDFLDEDDMSSDSATAVPSQQSVKAYVDANAAGVQIFDVDASVGANALKVEINPQALVFRSATLTDGTPVTREIASTIDLTVSSGSTLGTSNGVAARLVILAIDNAGTVEVAVTNLAGGVNLDETTLISTTAEGGAGGADSADVIYSTTSRSNVAFRVVGFIDITEATAGTWATAPTTVQGAGGNAITAMQSIGYGQTWQDVTASRSLGVTYTNTTGKPIMVVADGNDTGAGSIVFTIDGVTVFLYGDGGYAQIFVIIPPGSTYEMTITTGTLSRWVELR